MKTYLLLFISSIIALGTACAQERSFIKKKFDHFTVDILDNFYGWNDECIEKYSPEGILVASYSNKSFGYITSVDASIPSKIMVLYQEFGTIQFLDSKLSPLGNSLNLFDKDIFSVSAAAISSPNTIVLFDVSSQRLILTDFDLNIIHTTPCYFSKDFNPNHINTLLDKEILLIEPSGIYFFDKFGSFEKHIAITDISSSQLNKNFLFYLRHNQLYSYDLLSLETTAIPTDIGFIKEFRVTNNNIFMLEKSGTIYKSQIKTKKIL